MRLGRRKSERPRQALGAPAVGPSMLVWSEFVSSSSMSRAPAGRRGRKVESGGEGWPKEKLPPMQVRQ